jgi:hypothetical protein
MHMPVSEVAYQLDAAAAADIADKITDVVINHLRRHPEFASVSRIDLEIRFGDLRADIASILKHELDRLLWIQE